MNRQPLDLNEEQPRIDITPMLDVVFILLIFFIVTATFIKEVGIEVSQPHSAVNVPLTESNILISLAANDDIWINQRQVDIRQLRPNIERLHTENPEGGVIIQADDDSRNELLVKVMDVSRAAGVYNVSLVKNTP